MKSFILSLLFVSCLGLGSTAFAAEATPPPVRAPARSDDSIDKLARSLVGAYSSDRATAGIATVNAVGSGMLTVASDEFSSVGYFDGREFGGVVIAGSNRVARTPSGALAWVRMTVQPDGRLEVTRWVGPGDADVVREAWVHGAPGAPAAPPPVTQTSLPKFGEYVYVEELPQAIQRVPPDYPPAARDKHIEGTVLVQILVDRSGRVADTKIVKSVPELDGAAVAALKQWLFKPARSKGVPVAVWVAVPMKFTLN